MHLISLLTLAAARAGRSVGHFLVYCIMSLYALNLIHFPQNSEVNSKELVNH